MNIQHILANNTYYVPLTEINENSREHNFRVCSKIKKLWWGGFLVEYKDWITGNFHRKTLYPAGIQEVLYEQINN